MKPLTLTVMCSSALQTDHVKPPKWSACVSSNITASYRHDASCNHHSSKMYLLISCLAELYIVLYIYIYIHRETQREQERHICELSSKHCFHSFFPSCSQFSSYPALLYDFPRTWTTSSYTVTPYIFFQEQNFSRRSWNIPISLQLSDYNLWPRWPRKVMHCGVPLRGSLTDQQLSFTCLLSISSSQNKAQGRGEKMGRKGRAIKG